MEKKQAVVVFNSHQNICFGYVDVELNGHNQIKLTGARRCRYYITKEGEHGAHGLATVGPQKGSKIEPRVTITICDVANVLECTDEAAAAWEKELWS